jgi:hypothetical protein
VEFPRHIPITGGNNSDQGRAGTTRATAAAARGRDHSLGALRRQQQQRTTSTSRKRPPPATFQRQGNPVVGHFAWRRQQATPERGSSLGRIRPGEGPMEHLLRHALSSQGTRFRGESTCRPCWEPSAHRGARSLRETPARDPRRRGAWARNPALAR